MFKIFRSLIKDSSLNRLSFSASFPVGLQQNSSYVGPQNAIVGSMRRARKPNDYIEAESQVSPTYGREPKFQLPKRKTLTNDRADDETESSYCDSSGSSAVPDDSVEYMKTRSPQTPTMQPSRLSARYNRARRLRRRRFIESSSDLNLSPSPCPRMRSPDGSSFMVYGGSLSGRLESAILALDQLKSCLQGVKLDIDQDDGEAGEY